MTSESCAMLYFAGKKLWQCVSHWFSMPTPLPATSNSVSSRVSFSTWNCSAARVAVYSVRENEHL